MRVVAPPYPADLWLVARVDANALPADRAAEVFGWLTGLGVPYRECVPRLVVTQDAATRCRLLHLSRFALDSGGQKYVDHAADRVHTEPLVIAITDYPAWLVGVSQQQQKEADDERPRTDQ